MITSLLGDESIMKYEQEELLSLLDANLSVEGAIDKIVYESIPLDVLEASKNGKLIFSVPTQTWQIASKRSENVTKYAFLSSFSHAELKTIKAGWGKNVDVSNFHVKNEDLLMEIATDGETPATHCLFSLDTMASLLNEFYDLSNETEIIITDDNNTVFVGHKRAIERLYTPGSNYARKSYLDIQKEIWNYHE